MKRIMLIALSAILVVLALVLGLIFFANFGYTSENDISATVEQGGRLVSALEKYRATNGYYPDSLDKLTPDYAVRIPESRLEPWVYVKKSGGAFELSAKGGTVYVDFDRKNGKWVIERY